MINRFSDPIVIWSTTDCSTQSYDDFEDHWFDQKPIELSKLAYIECGPFIIEADETYLTIRLTESELSRDELRDILDNADTDWRYLDGDDTPFQNIWAVGFDFLNLDQIGAMSEAEAIVFTRTYPDWIASVRKQAAEFKGQATWDTIGVYELTEIDWKNTRLWSAIDYYQLRSPLDDLIDDGYCSFRLHEIEED